MNTLKTLTLALAIGGSALYTVPARADHCCDSFWSCLGAVVTAGASCAVQHATVEIERLLENAQNVKEQGDRIFDASIGELNNAMLNATRSATDHFDSIGRNSVAHERQARDIYQQVNRDYQTDSSTLVISAINAAPILANQNSNSSQPRNLNEATHVVQQGSASTRAARSEVQQAARPQQVAPSTQATMQQGVNTANTNISRDDMLAAMQAAQQKISQLTQDSSRGYETARRNLERVHQQAVDHMRDVFSTSFAAPMVGAVIGPLSATIVDPVAFLVTITSINRTLEVTIATFGRMFPPAVNHSNGLLANSMNAMQNTLNQATNRTSESGRIVNAMRELQRRADRYAYSQLNDLTGHQGSSVASQGTVRALGSSGSGTTLQFAPANDNNTNTALLSALNVQYKPQFESQLTNELRNLSQQSKQLEARLTSGQNTGLYKRQFDQLMTNEFSGKDQRMIDAKKRELINEANRYFAKDPNLKNKAQQLLNTETTKFSTNISRPTINQATPPKPEPKPVPKLNTAPRTMTAPQGIKPIVPGSQLPQGAGTPKPEPKPVPKLNSVPQTITPNSGVAIPNNQLPQGAGVPKPEPKPVPKLSPGIQSITQPGR